MKVPLSWLKEYIHLDQTPEEIGDLLTRAGLEVEKIDEISPSFTDVIAAKVLDMNPHPYAEKLCIAKVSDGKETYEVVCGAPNCRKGLLTAFAKVGATIAGKSIKKAVIRDVESFGMLCSEKELGIGDNHEGILTLDPEMKEGTDLKAEYSDTIFEISLTPNLGHCMSILGVARELSAMLDKPVIFPAFKLLEKENETFPLKAEIKDVEKCFRYGLRFLKDITVKPSPKWLQKRLELIGMRSINNVVDVTNYVMHEYGLPLHAFDYEKVKGKIIVDSLKKPVPFTTLDGILREIPEGTLMIGDEKESLAIAGVMGGKNSSVTQNTHSILLEAAYFNPLSIRKTSRVLNLRSESSSRFEKQIDPLGINIALDRAAFLLQITANATICDGILNIDPHPYTPKILKCRVSTINRLLGTSLSLNEIENLLRRLGITVKKEDENIFIVSIPSYRNDINEEIDLVEEVARIYGFNFIEQRPFLKAAFSTVPHFPLYFFFAQARDVLMREGLQEFMTCDLISPEQEKYAWAKERKSIEVLHPSSQDQSILRTSLLPGLLNAVKYNHDHGCSDIAAFEIGKIHYKIDTSFKENQALGIILSGRSHMLSWAEKERIFDFFDLKGIIENIFSGLKIPFPSLQTSESDILHPKRQALLALNGNFLGILGEINPLILQKFDLQGPVYFAEISLELLQTYQTVCKQMEPLPQYPGSERDWTLTLRKAFPMEKVFDAIKSADIALLKSVSLLYIFESEKIGKDRKNVTLRFTYRDDDKTLSMEDVEKAHQFLVQKVISALSDNFFPS